jgi:DNA polymerase-3 subunit epsilon
MTKLERQIIEVRNAIIDFSRGILSNKTNYVILDTETTGLGENDVIIQLSMIDCDGNALMDTLIKPTKRKRMSSEAIAVHGITMAMLKDAPTFRDIYPRFCEIVKGKKILIYNGQFDGKMIIQTALQDGINFKTIDALCIMIAYAAFVGDWSDYHKSYSWKKLPGGDHTAIGDCRATLKLIHKMAKAEMVILPPKKWWQFF